MHIHDDADEIFYILDGNLTFFIGKERIEANPGAFVYLPRFVEHGFQVSTRARWPTTTTLRLLTIRTSSMASCRPRPSSNNTACGYSRRGQMGDEASGAGSRPKESVPSVPAYIERRENCPRYVFGGGVWIVLADKAQTSGNVTNVESIYQQGGGLPRLLHECEAEMAYAISGRLRIPIGDEAETTAEPGAMVFVPRGVARRFTADGYDTRLYHGFVPAAFEQLLVEHSVKTELMTVPIGDAPFDPAMAMTFGTHLVPE